MIFVDANYFLRLLAPPATSHDLDMAQQSAHLFRQARSGRKQITTSDAILAEVAFLLTSPTSYGLPVDQAARLLRTAIEVRGMRAARKSVWLNALTIWSDRPSLGFVDALTAAYVQADGHELATFDAKLSKYPGISLYSENSA